MNAAPRLLAKSATPNAAWAAAWAQKEPLINPSELDRLFEKSVERVRLAISTYGGAVGYAWSGGKDAQAVRLVCDAAGVGVAALFTNSLEYPAFEKWLAAHAPKNMVTIDTGQDVDFLILRPRLLFPNAPSAWAETLRVHQWAGFDEFRRVASIRAIITGKRTMDGNVCGPDGIKVRNSDGAVEVNPLYDWPHEAVLDLLKLHGITLPPFYDWPDGWVNGTVKWPWRDVADHASGWAATHAIDPELVTRVARYFPSGRDFLSSC